MTDKKVISLSPPQRRKLFASSLLAALERSNTNISELSSAIGIKYSRMHHWVSARSLPSIHVVQLISDYLGDDEIMRSAILVNTYRCANCNNDFLHESAKGTPHLCGSNCRLESRRLKDKTGSSSVQSTKFSAENLYQKAVARFCNGCEPSGMCVTPECALRPVSPLPLFSPKKAHGNNHPTRANT